MNNWKMTALVLVTVAASCTAYNWPYDLEDRTPVQSIMRPGDYKVSGYGTVLAPLHRPDGGDEMASDYIVVTSGPASPTAMHKLGDVDDVSRGKLFYMYAGDIHHDDYDLLNTGYALASVPRWNYVGDSLGCAVIGEPGFADTSTRAGGFSIFCTYTPDDEFVRRIEGTDLRTSSLHTPREVGRSIAVILEPGTDSLAYVLAGADGSAHLVGNELAYALAPSLEPPDTLPTEEFGVAVAGGTLGGDWPAWVAVGSHGRIYVFGIWDDPATGLPDGPDPDHVWLQACWERPGSEGFGSLLWSGDLDGDGNMDLVASTHPDIDERSEDVVVVYGTAFDVTVPDPYPVVDACTPIPEDVPFTCTDYDPRDVTCGEFPDFGASVAMGDLDGDGTMEIAIGAPGATVEGRGASGAVFVYSMSDPGAPASVLRDATPHKKARLGTDVAVVNVAGEDELVAGGPGDDEIFVFWCSGVGTDNPSDSEAKRCR